MIRVEEKNQIKKYYEPKLAFFTSAGWITEWGGILDDTMTDMYFVAVKDGLKARCLFSIYSDIDSALSPTALYIDNQYITSIDEGNIHKITSIDIDHARKLLCDVRQLSTIIGFLEDARKDIEGLIINNDIYKAKYKRTIGQKLTEIVGEVDF